jgi:succinate-semialdehyde dehydrogenase/glutarate-semialdehyde dehydrogenase
MTLEMGKPIQAAIDEAAKCATGCRYYAEHGPSYVADASVDDDGHRSFVSYQPLGVVLAIMPWNFPFWQVIRFLAPALVAGQRRPAQARVERPGVRAGARVARPARRRAGRGVPGAAHRQRRGGGTARRPARRGGDAHGKRGSWRSVGKHAGEHLKKTVLELGGSDAFVVMPSADLDKAIGTAVKARTINNGPELHRREAIHRSSRDRRRFLSGFSSGMQALRMGDPLDPEHAARARSRRRDWPRSSRRRWRSRCEGSATRLRRPPRRSDSAFFPPTVLTDIPPESPAYRDELFGPVGCVFVATDIDDAIRIANDTRFGLGSSAWTNDAAEQERSCASSMPGALFINDMVGLRRAFPFGGVKASGYGAS